MKKEWDWTRYIDKLTIKESKKNNNKAEWLKSRLI